MVTPNWDLPLPNYNAETNSVMRIYMQALTEMVALIESLSTRGDANREITIQQQNAVIAQMAVIMATLDRESETIIRQIIEQAFFEGQAETLVALGEAATVAEARTIVGAAGFTTLSTATISAMSADTFEDLLTANQKMKRESVKMVRAVVAENLKMKALQGEGVNSSKNAIVAALNKKELRERFNVEGNVAIVDRLGRRWKLDKYAEMVTRTKMLQAHTEGIRVQALERGVDLAIISSHGATDACKHYEGMVVSMNGETEGFIKYEDLRKSNLIFHPNCKHRITPLRDVSLLPEEVRKNFEQKQKNAKKLLNAQKRK